MREIAEDILRSWRLELSQLGRTLWSSFAQDRKSPLTVTFGKMQLTITRTDAPRSSELGVIERGRNEDRPSATRLAQLCNPPDAARDIALRFSESTVLRARVSMPKASRRVLLQALRYELSRLIPLEPELLYFDFRVEPNAKSTTAQDIKLRIVKRAEIDQALDICHDAGLQVGSIGFAGDPHEADFRLFPVDRMALLRTLWRRWNALLLAALALLLGLVFLVVAVARETETGRALSLELGAAQIHAAIVERLQQRVRNTIAESGYLVRLKQAPMLTAILEDLSRTLPDNTSIGELALEGSKLRMSGVSQSASNLIALFDGPGLFANAQFTAPLTEDARTNAEHFDLSMEVRPHRP